MAISRDAHTYASDGSGTASTLTFSHTCASGALLFVSARGALTDTLTGITYNGSAMTFVGKKAIPSARYHYLYVLGAPTSGAHNVVISFSGNTGMIGIASSYLGTNNSSTVDSSNTGSANSGASSFTLSTTTVADNCWVFMYGANDNGDSFTEGANTSIIDQTGSGEAIMDTNAAQTPAGSKTMGVSWTGSDGWLAIMASFAPSTSIAYTLTCATGTFNLTGQDTAFKRALHIICATGSFVLTGIATGLSKGYRLVCSTGSFILTGFATLFSLKWNNQSKNSSTFSNQSKNSSSFSNQSKNSSSWTNSTKN